MSHTTKCEDGTTFIYNGDYSGEVKIISVGDNGNSVSVIVPMKDLVEFVSNMVRSKRIEELEDADPATLLGVKLP
jgi:hypothetical protein